MLIPWAEVTPGTLVRLHGGLEALVTATEPYYDRGVVEVEFERTEGWERDLPIPFYAWGLVRVVG